jgi:hypothetical protein
MRDHSSLPRFRAISSEQAAEHQLQPQELIREFQPNEVDLDDLAAAIRDLLDSGKPSDRDANARSSPDLLSRRRRATHVVGDD